MKHSVATDEILETVSMYSLGALDPPERSAFEEHLASGCEVCETQLQSFLCVGAALAMGVRDMSPPARVRRKLEEFLRAETRQQEEEEEESSARPALSQPASTQPPRPFITVRSDEGEWREELAGVHVKRLFVDRERGTVTSLFKLQPGTRVPEHFHSGAEECLVLEGDVCANDDTRLGPGDYHCAPAGSVHQQLTTVHGALLLIVAGLPRRQHAI